MAARDLCRRLKYAGTTRTSIMAARNSSDTATRMLPPVPFHDAIANSQLRVPGLGYGDRCAVVQADQDLLTGSPLDVVLHGVAGETTAEHAKHRRDIASGA